MKYRRSIQETKVCRIDLKRGIKKAEEQGDTAFLCWIPGQGS